MEAADLELCNWSEHSSAQMGETPDPPLSVGRELKDPCPSVSYRAIRRVGFTPWHIIFHKRLYVASQCDHTDLGIAHLVSVLN